MAFDTTPFVKDFTTLGVLFLFFLIFYAKFKGKSMGEAFKDLKENISDMFGDKEEYVPFEKKSTF